MFVPGLSGVLQIQPVAVTTWLMLLPTAASLLVNQIARYGRRRMFMGSSAWRARPNGSAS